MTSFVIRNGIGMETLPIVVLQMCYWVEKQMRGSYIMDVCPGWTVYYKTYFGSKARRGGCWHVFIFIRTSAANLLILSSADFLVFFHLNH